MKILYFVNGLNFKGGIARIVVDKVNYLAEHDGHDMTICTLNNSTQSFYPLSEKVRLMPFGGEKNEQDSVLGKMRKMVSIPQRVKQILNRGGTTLSLMHRLNLSLGCCLSFARKSPRLWKFISRILACRATSGRKANYSILSIGQ